jgi:hypothetical protein
MEIHLDTPIIQLGLKRLLSIRSVNVCESSEIFTVRQLLQFYNDRGNFLKFRNCGQRTKIDLEDFCTRNISLLKVIPEKDNSESNPEVSNQMIQHPNLEIGDLSQRHQWSVRTLNCCLIAGISDLEQLKQYYKDYGSFKGLKNCGLKTNLELIETLDFYLRVTGLNQSERSISVDINCSLEELASKHNWSIRTKNCCYFEGIRDLIQLLSYYKKHNSFLTLKKCGIRTNNELLETIRHYNESRSKIFSTKDQITQCSGLDGLVNGNYDKLFLNLPVSKSLKRVLHEFKLNTINDVANFRHVLEANRDNTELLNFVQSVKKHYSVALNLYNKMSLTSEIFGSDELVRETRSDINILLQVISRNKKNKVISGQLEYIFACWDERSINQLVIILLADLNTRVNYNLDFNNYLESEEVGVFRLFSFLKFYLLQDSNLNEIQNEILSKIIRDDIHVRSLQDIGNVFNLTRERIRQIRNIKFNTLLRDLHILKEISMLKISVFNYIGATPILEVNNDFCNLLNQAENCNYNRNFITIVLSRLYSDEFELVVMDGLEVLKFTEISILKMPANCKLFLIRRECLKQFLYRDFIQELKRRQNESKYSIQDIELDELILNYTRQRDQIHQGLRDIAINIINQFEDIRLTADALVVFPSNSMQKLRKVVQNILEEFASPMTINELREELQLRIPYKSFSFDYVRRAISGQSVFVSYGLSGYYGLSSWDKTVDITKTESVVNLVKKFLQNSSNPQHISVIYNDILRVRSTTERTIETMIRLDNSGEIISYGGGYFGLRKLHPEVNKFIVIPLIGSHFRFDALKRFHLRDFEDVVSDIAKRNGYFLEQVRGALIAKCKQGEVIIDSSGRFIVNRDISAVKNTDTEPLVESSAAAQKGDINEITDNELLKVIVPLISSNRTLKAIEVASNFYSKRGIKLSFMQWKKLIESVSL